MKIPIVVLFMIVSILAACAPTPTSEPLASQNGIEIYQAVVRLPGGGTSGTKSNTATLAGYMLIKNTGSVNDSLVGIQADFAGIAMFHKSTVDANGVASMNLLTSVAVPAGQTVEFKPGGLHVMFVGLNQDLKLGDEVTITLQFQNAGAISFPAQVTETGR